MEEGVAYEAQVTAYFRRLTLTLVVIVSAVISTTVYIALFLFN